MSIYERLQYTPRIRKDGTEGKLLDMAAYTPLHDCDLCGIRSTPKRVHTRNDIFGWNIPANDYSKKSKDMLCMGCWNKVRSVVKAHREADELQRLIRKLRTEGAKWQRSQTPES